METELTDTHYFAITITEEDMKVGVVSKGRGRLGVGVGMMEAHCINGCIVKE